MKCSIVLDILKAFDNVGCRGLLHKLSSDIISGRVYTIIKSLLSCTSMKVIVNSQSPEAAEINASIPHGSPWSYPLSAFY